MSDIETLQIGAEANRAVELIDRDQRQIKGDFEGSKLGTWQGLGPNGEGNVKYKDKIYKTKHRGYATLAPGVLVELTYVDGTYYSKY